MRPLVSRLQTSLVRHPPHFEHAHDARLPQPLEDDAHTLAALAELVLRLARRQRLDAALDAPSPKPRKEAAAPFIDRRLGMRLRLAQPVPDAVAQPRAEHHLGLDIRA